MKTRREIVSREGIEKTGRIQSLALSADIVQASSLGPATAGGGRLVRPGSSFPISVKAVGGGGLGARTIRAGARSGLILAEGMMHERLANDKVTAICLTGRTPGISTNFGIDGFVIELR